MNPSVIESLAFVKKTQGPVRLIAFKTSTFFKL